MQDQFEIGRLDSRLALGDVDHETFGSELTWNAEFGVGFGSGTRVTLSGGSAFRAPDSTDRFGFGGNPDLDPEVSRQVELSVRQKLGERQQVSLSAFDNRIRDLIDYVIIDFNTFEGQNQNIERARIKGVELGYQYNGEAWRARAGLTLQDPRDETTDERLLRRSRESLVLAVNRDVGALDLGVDVAALRQSQGLRFPDERHAGFLRARERHAALSRERRAHAAGAARKPVRRGLHARAGLSHRRPLVHRWSTLQLRVVMSRECRHGQSPEQDLHAHRR